MISLSGYSLIAAVLILTVMVAPIMVSIFCDALRAVTTGWVEGSLALGVNRWRTIWKISVHTARPGDHRRNRARDGAGARRGGDARDGLGLESGSPRTRPTG